MEKRILITVGGTGGHIYPAQALAQQLAKVDSRAQILFVGGGLSRNHYFDRDSFAYQEVPASTLGGSIPQKAKGLAAIMRGVRRSRAIIRDFKPDLVVGFGSYYTVPTLLAAKLSGVPIVLHEANTIPGKVNRLLSRYVKATGIHFPETASLLKGKTVEVGVPLRDGFTLALNSKAEARQYFGLDPKRFTFLVFGGSQGSLAINLMFCEAATIFLTEGVKHFQVIHVTGDEAMAQDIREVYEGNRIQACVKAFETRMDCAWVAADLAIGRAGASTIAEQIEFEVPGILIPFPRATDDHQARNADFMVQSVGGALKTLESETDADILAQMIRKLVADDHAKLKAMRESIRRYKSTLRRRDFCSVVCEMAGITVR